MNILVSKNTLSHSRKFIWAFWLTGVLAWQSLRAADTGQFLSMTAAPLPVVAGEPVRFQVLAINQGTETWAAPKTYLEAEIYDQARKYEGRTERFHPPADTARGKSLSASLTFRVPADYSGSYFFRVFLVHNDQRVIQGDYRPFSVQGKPGETKTERAQ
jgi:hypothetical protein